jgi:hypothetical protein
MKRIPSIRHSLFIGTVLAVSVVPLGLTQESLRGPPCHPAMYSWKRG